MFDYPQPANPVQPVPLRQQCPDQTTSNSRASLQGQIKSK